MKIKNNSSFSTIHSPLIRVAVVDDHQIVIDGLEKIIAESGIATLTGKAYSIATCLQMLSFVPPDVLLLDIGLPDGSGMDLCPKIKAQYLAMNILILTSYAEYTVISHVLNNGASGYILKNATSEEIIEGIQTVAAGKRFLCENVNLLLKKKEHNNILLTRRERELLKLITEGYTSVEIADKMYLGYETIRSYRKTLHLKLDAHNTAELTRIAIDMKLI
ncbi:MAG: response regulator transcription factor [Cytophagaceae bacterium]|jgi:DNA-binding NarL/FixJ family response regulator|nr:response regulator transcription factor [Cytophagaceae bacterium]